MAPLCMGCDHVGCAMMSWRHGPWSVAVTVGPPRASVHSEPLRQFPSNTRPRPRVHGSYTSVAAVTIPGAPVFIVTTPEAPRHSPGTQVHIITSDSNSRTPWQSELLGASIFYDLDKLIYSDFLPGPPKPVIKIIMALF